MKLKLAAGILGALLYFFASAQHIAKDSLLKIINSNNKDTQFVKALFEYGEMLQDEMADSAIYYYEKAHQLSLSLNYIKGISDYYRTVTFHYGVREGNAEKGLQLADEFLLFAEKQKTATAYSMVYFAYAVIYQGKQLPDSAVYYYEKCIPYFMSTGKKINTLIIYNNLASLFNDMDLPDKSIEYAEKAIFLAMDIQDTLGLINSHANIARANIYKKDTPAIFRHIKIAYQLSVAIKNNYSILVTASDLAETYKEMGQYDTAFIYYSKANKMAIELQSLPNISYLAINLADYYAVMKNWNKANECLKQAVKDTGNFDMHLSKKMIWYKLSSTVQTGLGNYKAAMQYLNTYLDLYGEENRREKTEKSLAFDTRLKKAEQEKALLQKEVKIKKQQTQITGLLTGTLALGGTGLFFFLYQRKKQQLKNKEIAALKTEREFIATKALLEGQLKERGRISKEIHDELGSSLTSIALLTEVLKKRLDTSANPEVNKISATSAEMVDKMNEIIWALNTSNDTINSLTAYIRKFAGNFLTDAGIALVYEEKNIPDEKLIEGIARRNIYLAIKEALNNIVKHSGATSVAIEVDTADGLKIEIKDNGKGINFEKAQQGGNGLANMRKRMEDIGGTFSLENTNGTLIKLNFLKWTRY
jgi:signal transduction histidine kinase